MSHIKFNHNKNIVFSTLKEKVQEYFDSNKRKPTGNFSLYLKSLLLISSSVALYTILVFFTPAAWISVLLCILLGLNIAFIGFNVMHDGAHGSFSSRKWVNKMMGYSLNVLGGTVYFWKIKHNILHHTFTNIESVDEDINLAPWIRVHPDQPQRWYHRFQHIYFVFLYGLSYLMWIFVDDMTKYFSGRIGNKQYQKMNIREHFIFWGSKLFYVGVSLILPIFMAGLLPTLIGYALAIFACGFTLSIVFQLAHVVENTDFPTLSEESKKIDHEWVVHQIRTTSNFATKSKVLTWLLGGLNYQVEHHLFPKISHVHYPHISELVRSTCMEFNIPYNEHPNFFSAVRSHILQLKNAGTC